MPSITRLIGIFTAIAAAAFIGFTGGASDQSAKAQTLVVAVPGTPASLDGEQALTSEGEMMMANIHAGDLFMYKVMDVADLPTMTVDLRSTDDRGVNGLVAESWETSADGKSVTVKLKQGMKSPYGNEITAEDYKWAWQRRFAVKGVGKFIGDVVGISGPDSTGCSPAATTNQCRRTASASAPEARATTARSTLCSSSLNSVCSRSMAPKWTRAMFGNCSVERTASAKEMPRRSA